MDLDGGERASRTDAQLLHVAIGLLEPVEDGRASQSALAPRALDGGSQRFERQPRRTIAGGGATHAVGDGQHATVVIERNQRGSVFVDGLAWTARAENDGAPRA